MSVRIAINGFGRIGRHALKIALEKSDVEVVAINDLAGARVLAHLLKYDSVYGIYPQKIQVEEEGKTIQEEGTLAHPDHFSKSSVKESYLLIGQKRVRVIAEKEAGNLPWEELKIDVVLECTGRLTEADAASVHLKAGAKRVVVSAPTSSKGGSASGGKGGSVETFLLGVNQEKYQGQEIVSNASCTTNCISPVAKIMKQEFGILKATMTTIHAYTAEQNLVDGLPPQLHSDLRRARAAGLNIVPTTTGAATAAAQVIPSLKGLFDGLAIRVPVASGSLADFTFVTKKKTTVEEVNQVFLKAKDSKTFKDILDATFEPLVSSDIVGSRFSAVVDLSLTQVVDGDLVKVVAWYDNEWGYANRLVELAQFVGRSLSHSI